MVCGPSDNVAGHQDPAAYGEEGLRAGGYRVRGRGYDASVRRDELKFDGLMRFSFAK